MTTLKPVRKVIPRERLDVQQIDRMFYLMDTYYTNIRFEDFHNDLQSKTAVICLFNPNDNQLVGFSTLKEYFHLFESKELLILFSGDTILEKEFWGSQELALGFGDYMLHLMKTYPLHDIYWLLISKGFRTYKYLPAFFKEYYPNPVKETPLFYRNLMHSLAHQAFPDRYDEKSGVIKMTDGPFLKEQYHPQLKKGGRTEKFFYQHNPGYIHGDELVCITELKAENICDFMKRILKL